MIKTVILYYLVINIIAFVLYGDDKQRAKQHLWRIPEKTLLGVALLGGGVGAFVGMQIFRHKTKHASFCVLVPVCIILHVILCYMLLFM